MATMTITEALAEIKTIGKRVEKKQEFVTEFIVTQAGLRDPLEAQGGSREAIKAERQAITDLRERVVKIRRAIHAANQTAEVPINGVTRTIADWLVWRRDVSGASQRFLNDMHAKINKARGEWRQRGWNVAGESPTQDMRDLMILVDESELAREREKMEETLATLDGLLSLKNATVMIEVAD